MGEHDITVAPLYVLYAKALLRKAQAESDPFGGGLKEKGVEKDAGGSGAAAADDEDVEEGGEEGEGGEGEEGEGGEEADDLELAYQCFEVGRVLYEKVLPPTHTHTPSPTPPPPASLCWRALNRPCAWPARARRCVADAVPGVACARVLRRVVTIWISPTSSSSSPR